MNSTTTTTSHSQKKNYYKMAEFHLPESKSFYEPIQIKFETQVYKIKFSGNGFDLGGNEKILGYGTDEELLALIVTLQELECSKNFEFRSSFITTKKFS